ncbi:MAG: hypothetical protein ABI863_08850 [Ginsengibacter sp.]
MRTSEANIEVKRNEDGLLSSISVIMPTWNKVDHENVISITIPLFGIKTFANDNEDCEVAIQEAIKCFCIAAEKFGQGLEAELQALNWSITRENKLLSSLNFSVETKDVVLEQIMETGDQFVEDNLMIA